MAERANSEAMNNKDNTTKTSMEEIIYEQVGANVCF